MVTYRQVYEWLFYYTSTQIVSLKAFVEDGNRRRMVDKRMAGRA
ncbi:hypothetical protein SOVF_073020 [Spinacia oleracea]|nr:hypothetical protein SOVF_073020 [Spinacia oleracea]